MKSVWRWIKRRAREGSTWAGFGAIGAIVTAVTGIPEAAQIGGVIAESGGHVLGGGTVATAVGAGIASLLALFLPDSGGK